MRLALLTLPLIALGSIAHANPGEQIALCRNIADTTARLACYDAISLPASGTAAADESAAFGRPAREASDRDQVIHSVVVSPTNAWNGKTRFTLENGQVWEVADGSSGAFGPSNRRVTITRAALGSFRMRFEGLNSFPRVRRIK